MRIDRLELFPQTEQRRRGFVPLFSPAITTLNSNKMSDRDPRIFQTPVADSTTVFSKDLFKGKVLFCTGGGSGICYGMVLQVR